MGRETVRSGYHLHCCELGNALITGAIRGRTSMDEFSAEVQVQI